MSAGEGGLQVGCVWGGTVNPELCRVRRNQGQHKCTDTGIGVGLLVGEELQRWAAGACEVRGEAERPVM